MGQINDVRGSKIGAKFIMKQVITLTDNAASRIKDIMSKDENNSQIIKETLNNLKNLKGEVKKFKSGIVPHMGWNRLLIKHKSPLLNDIAEGSMVYFAHSYYVEPENKDIIMTETDYGINFASSICKNNLFGIQFHPEKSSEIGLKMLKNFGGLVKNV